ncbi:DUF397 domain-containing protein [Kitasatospora sp. NPDC058965]|uniref:DUF397 domain-containing protein n=1 Tax=Kitasatospora sp. NPDC058965 TaxID=3346682 RepID=UPI00369BBDC4
MQWHESTHSEGDGGECVEVAMDFAAMIPVRDSRDPYGPQLAFSPAAWSDFVQGVGTVELDAA